MAHNANPNATPNTTADVILQLYELSGGMRFICDALQDGPSDVLGLLRLVGERIEDCASRLDGEG